jgi:SAM-dependent methyltransferase
MDIKKIIQRKVNQKFAFINRFFKTHESFCLLDIGCGNHSAFRTMKVFPKCKYYGLDVTRSYANNSEDFNVMEDFYEIDLTQLDLSIIPDNYFDVIIMSHIIEHLPNADELLPIVLTKLKNGGCLYIEYPGKKSLKLPSMHGCLNFYDDPTHVRVYSQDELKKIIIENNCTVIKSGLRRNFYYIIAMPFRIVGALIKKRPISGNIFWDILGFAEYLQVRK